MRAFVVAWRSLVSFYNEMFLLISINLIWWLTGGVFVLLMATVAWSLLAAIGITGPWWLALLLAIPAGPANAALAVVTRRCARDIHVDRSFYWNGFKTYWKQALAISAIGMGVLALLLLNVLFYVQQTNAILKTLAILWVYLILFWLTMQIYVYPILVSLEKPTVLGAIKTAALAAFANPLYSMVLLIVAAALTALSVVLAILVLMAWPALMLLLGEHSLRLFLERAGVKVDDGTTKYKSTL